MSAPEKEIRRSHFNDWPNTQGFDVTYEERTPVELKVDGTIPAYAAGVLFRTGLGPREVETDQGTTFKVNHWFDNLAQVHRFQIHAPTNKNDAVRVTYNSRSTCDGLIANIKKNGNRDEVTFGAKYDPCKSFFQKLQSVFQSQQTPKPADVNVCVTISPNFPGLSRDGHKSEHGIDSSGVATLCNKTDATVLQMLDPETLEPIGIANQAVLHQDLKGPMSAAHAELDPVTGDVYNYNLEFGRNSTYRVFTVSAATGRTSILASIKYAPAYLHSLFLTENYVILSVWNSFYKAGGMAMLWKKNFVDSIADLDRTKPARWFVIDKKPQEQGGRGLVATYDSDPFFAFHSVNAYEEIRQGGGVDIVADIPVYENMDCLKHFYIDNLLSDSPSAKIYCDPSNTAVRPRLRRFRLPDVRSPASKEMKAVSEFTADYKVTLELPTFNMAKKCKQHRFIYGVLDTGKSTFFDGLGKYDVQNHETKLWSVHGQTAGEPIFVADPESAEEDGGVLLSVVLDGIAGKSYLLVLDAKNMEEIGRARVDGVIGFGFHGAHVPAPKAMTAKI